MLLALWFPVVAAPDVAQPLPATPAQMRGPFYPANASPKAGDDLATVDGRTRAHGVPLHLSGRVLDRRGQPLSGVRVEIWQTNGHGRYHHPRDDSPAPIDPHFRGHGNSLTDAAGNYRFTTVRPVAYPGRTPHVHFRLSRDGRELLVTQMYLPDEHERNARDGLFRSVGDAQARTRLMGVAEPGVEGPRRLRFDIVVAASPAN